MKIVTVLGARPQFIKAAAVSREIKGHENIEEIIIHTGQHYDNNMSDIFFKEMEIPTPNYFLNINGQGHGAMTGKMMIEIEQILINEQPDIVLVYGDTNSTLAAALTAKKLKFVLCHVESGLRNHDLTIPEDINRILTDRISDILICSTNTAIENLKKEGFDAFPCEIHKTGDLMADVFYSFSKNLNSSISLPTEPFILTTVHRESNTNIKEIKEICSALNKISSNQIIVFPTHPKTKNIIKNNNLYLNDNISLIEPVGYSDMLQLLINCDYVITDSGGLQREAYLARKKSLLLMEYTPWVELVENNFTVLSKISRDVIVENFLKMKKMEPDFTKILYGDGTTAKSIVNILLSYQKDNYVN